MWQFGGPTRYYDDDQRVLLDSGKLKLGTWQGIYFCDFDGPRSRKVFIQIAGE